MLFCQVLVFISKTIQQVLVKSFRLLKCDAVSLDKLFSTFRKKVFPCFFLGCKANARVSLAKTGHGPHSF